MTSSGTHPPFDPELAVALAELPVPATVTPDLVPVMAEGNAALAPSNEDLSRSGQFVVSESQVPGPDGASDVSLLICRPAALEGTAPAVFFIHGGGMVMGTNRTGIECTLEWAEAVGAVIVSVEYRLAPAHPHPAPVEDCYAGLCGASERATELGIDPGRLLVAGESAGGGLAAAVALMARDRHGPALVGQMLICPMLDDRNETPSSFELDGEGVWDRTSNFTGWQALLGDRCGGPDVSPYAAPSRATDLSELPPAYVDVGSVETFRDEDVDYAVRLWRAGVDAELHVWPGGFHGFDLIVPQATLSRRAQRARIDWLRRTLSP